MNCEWRFVSEFGMVPSGVTRKLTTPSLPGVKNIPGHAAALPALGEIRIQKGTPPGGSTTVETAVDAAVEVRARGDGQPRTSQTLACRSHRESSVIALLAARARGRSVKRRRLTAAALSPCPLPLGKERAREGRRSFWFCFLFVFVCFLFFPCEGNKLYLELAR